MNTFVCKCGKHIKSENKAQVKCDCGRIVNTLRKICKRCKEYYIGTQRANYCFKCAITIVSEKSSKRDRSMDRLETPTEKFCRKLFKLTPECIHEQIRREVYVRPRIAKLIARHAKTREDAIRIRQEADKQYTRIHIGSKGVTCYGEF
jgi:hypothetical protein